MIGSSTCSAAGLDFCAAGLLCGAKLVLFHYALLADVVWVVLSLLLQLKPDNWNNAQLFMSVRHLRTKMLLLSVHSLQTFYKVLRQDAQGSTSAFHDKKVAEPDEPRLAGGAGAWLEPS